MEIAFDIRLLILIALADKIAFDKRRQIDKLWQQRAISRRCRSQRPTRRLRGKPRAPTSLRLSEQIDERKTMRSGITLAG